ncbi:C40 family peptidase [Actinomadura algeriensis]|uniref:Cell wall-associated NlpC family hydrolase n=1 Tax=Actinomadura algeriensis TaxID=1679523 RepID=A0ABR9JX38_9ACTN|nr:C40 family peptidase [Actinomadura algeriensis]MBE1535142.1 cell wall-associated NlpC family hydrolase [Actinomadura algeriensis]
MTNDHIGEPKRRKGGLGTAGAFRGLAVAACLAVTTSLVSAPVAAHADPQPTAAEAQKKLNELNEKVDQYVEKYNQIGEKLKIAKKKYKAAQNSATEEQAKFDEQRRNVAAMAADAYKKGGDDATNVAGFASSENPQAILDQAAVFSLLSRDRSSELTQFIATTQRLRREQAQAKTAYEEVKAKSDEIKKHKDKVEKEINKQQKLVRSLGGTTSSSGGSGSVGGSYNGPASGAAGTALDFAYAQLGKPYGYGMEGPNSYDCSGLTMKAWGAAGVSITRTTNSQWAATKRVSKENLQPGDLVFFSGLGHVGMYVGNGKMIHAPRTGKNVEVVSITSGYYLNNYYGAGRP